MVFLLVLKLDFLIEIHLFYINEDKMNTKNCQSKTYKSGRGKEMSLSRSIGSYYKLPKSDPNAVYLLPTAIYLLQCCFIAANIVWAGQCDNSLFPWKLYKINLTAQQTINTAIKISVNVNWCYSTPRLLLPNFSWQLIF